MRRLKDGETVQLSLSPDALADLRERVEHLTANDERAYHVGDDGLAERLSDKVKTDARKQKRGAYDASIRALEIGETVELETVWMEQQAVRKAAQRIGAERGCRYYCASHGDHIRVTRLAPGADAPRRAVKYPFARLNVGDSFRLEPPYNRPSVAASAQSWRLRGVGTYSLASQPDGTLLVTRTS